MTVKKLALMALACVMVLALGVSAITLDTAEAANEVIAVEEAELQAENELYVSSDYNSATEGWGTTHFSNYSGAFEYAKYNAKNATIVFEKTNTISGNCIDHNTHKTLRNLNITVRDGAVIGNANSKWDVTYDIVLEPGSTLKSARPVGSSVGYTHVKDGGSITVGEAGADKIAIIDFHKGTYQDMSIAILWQGSFTANNALINLADLGMNGSATFTDSTVNIRGNVAFGKGAYSQTMTNTTMTVRGHYLYKDNTYFTTTGTLLNKLTMNNSSIIVDDGVDSTVAENVTIKSLTLNDSSVTVEEGTPVSVEGTFKILTSDDASRNAPSTLKAGTVNIKNEITIDTNSVLDVNEITGAGNIIVDLTGYDTAINLVIDANISDSFTGTVSVINGVPNAAAKIDDNGNIVVFEATASVTDASGLTTFCETFEEAVGMIATDGSETTIKLYDDIELNKSIVFNYGTGNVIFTADKPVTVKQTAVMLDYDFSKSEDVNIIIGENVTFEIYDNASGMYLYYGPSLQLSGSVTGGQNWGVLYLFNGKHAVTETGKMGVGRVQLGYTEIYVSGEIDTNYLLVEGSTFTADGATIDANVIFDNNNGGQRWGKSEFKIKNGSEVVTKQLTLSYEGSVLSVDMSSTINAEKILGTGKIVIDATDYKEGDACPIIGNASEFKGVIEVTGAALLAVVDENGSIEFVKPVASIIDSNNNVTYQATLTEAFATVDDGETIELLPVEISEGTIKLPVTLKNVKLVGVENAVIKDTVIMAHDGNAISYEGITVENVVFDNSYFSITGWRANGVVLKNFTFKNNTFKNIDNTSNTAAVHFNLAEHEAMSGFVFENNTIENVLGGSKSGVYAQVTGDVTIKNNLIKNVAFRPFVIQVTTDDGVADNVTVTENTFRGSATGRLQLLGNNKAGTDTVSIKTTENAILDTTDAQAICYWNFNDEATTADFSKNYYGVIDPTEDFNKFYYNKSASSYEDIINMGILPYYTDATFDANGKHTELTNLTEGLTKNITVVFDEVLPAVEGEKTYNINLVSNDEAIINRLNSGDLTFKLNVTEPGKVAYEILDIADDNITVAMVNNDANRYEFHFDTKTNVENDTAKTITIAKVKFTGYGDFTFVVDSDKKTNTVHTTTKADNIVDTYLPAGITESDGTAPEGTLDLGTGVKTQIKVPTRNLVINVAFPNAVEKKAAAYQAMKVTVSGGDLAEAVVVDLGAENVETAITSEFEKNDAKYTVEVADGYKVTLANVLTVNTTYNVTVEGAGYRTARYTVTMTDVKTLNFWNNVKDNAVEVEDGKSASATSKNFLAGDIVADNQINIYDLSAVVSYFATSTSADYEKYTKYDLNRDGKIDSKDVAYVLVSWGE